MTIIIKIVETFSVNWLIVSENSCVMSFQSLKKKKRLWAIVIIQVMYKCVLHCGKCRIQFFCTWLIFVTKDFFFISAYRGLNMRELLSFFSHCTLFPSIIHGSRKDPGLWLLTCFSICPIIQQKSWANNKNITKRSWNYIYEHTVYTVQREAGTKWKQQVAVWVR